MVNERELLELVEKYGWNDIILYSNLTEDFFEKYRKHINFYKLNYSSKLSKEFILKNYTHKNDYSLSNYCFYCNFRLKRVEVLKYDIYYCPKCLL